MEPTRTNPWVCKNCGTIGGSLIENGVCPRCALTLALTGSLNNLEPRELENAPVIPVDFELIAELGRGASAVVWMALQKSLNRMVALKLLPTQGDARQIQRLEREAKAVASLNHTNIVSVFAFGSIGNSTYLAMALVEGGDLRTALNGRPMAANPTALLVRQLADALDHAHAHGVLHRDIKPSNILLNERREALLADFGLAGPLGGQGDLTLPGQVAGTAAYLAPELLEGVAFASARSDLYSLGAVLYECLTGRPPFVGDSAASILALVATKEPPAPSLLNPDVPADLETICLKCLEKNPVLRYESASALRAELDRYLDGRPILARPLSRATLLLRWGKRNPLLATVSAVALVLLIGLAIGGPVVALRFNRAKQRAESAQNAEAKAHLAADQEAATSHEILNFLQNDILANASPSTEPDREIKLRTVLDRAATTVDGRFPNQPLVEAAIHETLANTYLALGEKQSSDFHVGKALSLYIREKGPAAPEVLRLRYIEITDDIGKGRFVEAETLAKSVLEAQRRILPPNSPELFPTWEMLIWTYKEWNKWAEATATANEAYEASKRALGEDDAQTIRFEGLQASLFYNQQRYAEALPIFRHCLATAKRALGTDSPCTLDVMSGFAVLLTDMGNSLEAQTLDRELLAIRKRVLGDEHAATALTKVNLAIELSSHGNALEAYNLYCQADQTYLRVYGPEDQRTLNVETRMISGFLRMERYDEALAIATRNWPIVERTFGPEHDSTLLFLLRLAQTYLHMGRTDKAIEVAKQLLAICQRIKKPGDEFLLLAQWTTAEAYCEGGRYTDAEVLYLDAIAAVHSTRHEQDQYSVRAEMYLAALRTHQGRFAEAEVALQRGFSYFAHQSPDGDEHLIAAQNLADLLARRGAFAEAEILLRKVAQTRERNKGINATLTLQALDHLAVVLALQGKLAESETQLRINTEHWAKFAPGGWSETVNHIYLGWVLLQLGKKSEAHSLLTAGYLRAKQQGRLNMNDRPLWGQVLTKLSDTYSEAGELETREQWQTLSTW